MSARETRDPRAYKGQMGRISTVAWLTLICFSLTTIALLWTGVILAAEAISHSP